jgi:hypothetical protein
MSMMRANVRNAAPRLRHAVGLARRRRVVDDGLALFARLRRSIVSGDMGRHVDRAQILAVLLGVISLVLANARGLAGLRGFGRKHGFRGFALRRAACQRRLCAHRQTIAVFHQRMAHSAKLGLAALRLAIQAAVRIGGAGMRIVAALLVVEVRPVAGVRSIFGLEALTEAHASISVPSTEKCSSDSSGSTRRWFSKVCMNRWSTSPSCNRSRFLLKVVGTQTGASGDKPTNQRNSRL